jgi:beta-galactosidase GanA
LKFALLLLLVVLLTLTASAFDRFITLTNGYLAEGNKPWTPQGIAYQTWNRPLGVWQTYDQIDYDLDEMVKMGVNCLRVDFVWQHIEGDGDNQFNWTNYDYLVSACEKRGLRLIPLIAYQWPPSWFPGEWYTMHPPASDSEGIFHPQRWRSDIINYEHPDARAQYAEFMRAVCARYKDSKAILAWVIGNEYGYLGLWSGLLDGYDPWCEQAFRNWCQNQFTNISNVNARWGSTYTNFSAINLLEEYQQYGREGAQWADMIQWREDSIASFAALGAAAARAADPNHLLTYSTVGMQWGEEDWRYHAEDRGKITRA